MPIDWLLRTFEGLRSGRGKWYASRVVPPRSFPDRALPCADPHQPSAVLVRAQLTRILASEIFSRSERLSVLLKFIVEKTLEGQGDALKEHVLAMEVYGKGSDFNAAENPIVRVDARRLRDKLREYYMSTPHEPVIISVPKGGYAALFEVVIRQEYGNRNDPGAGTQPATGQSSTWNTLGALPARLLVGGVAVVLWVAVWAWFWRDAGPPSTADPAAHTGTLAVLPLENLSQETEQDYFADGLTEALITRLSSLRGLRVISRGSVMRFKGTRQPVTEIAAALQVAAVVEGAVLRSGNRVRVTVRLVTGHDGRSVWGRSYERELSDVLTLQSEVAYAIAGEVSVALTPGEQTRFLRARTVLPAAYEQYLKGRFEWRKATRPALEESVRHFQRAIDIDGSFAPAHAGLARAYNSLCTLFIGAAPPSELRPKAIAAATRALHLDPDLSEAHAELGFAHMRDWRWTEAGTAYRRAVDLSPSDAEILAQFSDYLGALGRSEEALGMARQALALDPLSPFVQTNLGVQLYAARRYEEAITQIQRVVNVNPSFVAANMQLGWAFLELGRFDEAIAALTRVVSLTKRNPAGLGALAGAYGRAGRLAQARDLLNDLVHLHRTEYVPSAAFVYAYAGLPDRDEAFVWTERAYSERSNLLAFLKTFPLLDPLRSDPRFAVILARVAPSGLQLQTN